MDDRRENLRAEGFLNLFGDLAGVGRPAVEHGAEDPYREAWIGFPAGFLNQVKEVLEPSHGEILALQGNYHGLGGHQGVRGEEAEGR